MMRRLPFLLLLAPALFTTAAGAARICSVSVCASGATRAGGGHYQISGTFGQTVIGVTAGAGYATQLGFWYPAYHEVTGIGQEIGVLPRAYQLEQNRPNPFSPATTIRFSLPERVHVTLRLYDVMGRLVRTLLDRELEAGYHSVGLESHGLASGLYACRMEAGSFCANRRIVLLK